jgi:putative restriction endonuclease
MTPDGDDRRIRLAAFDWLSSLTQFAQDGVVHWQDLVRFEFEGQTVPLIGATGIWKPKVLRLPISVATAPPRAGKRAPYNDAAAADGTLSYRYRGTDPAHPNNEGVREVMHKQLPLIYLGGMEKGKYMAFWPTYVVRDDPRALTFSLLLDSMEAAAPLGLASAEGVEPRRRYVTTAARHRLHQTAFRLRVLKAYRNRCAICKLGHERLLDAAHIIPDSNPEGVPATPTGLTLCKIHHAAFDVNILGIDQDYTIHVRRDIMDEQDGPMLRYGLQGFAGSKLLVIPDRKDQQPGRDLLALRFVAFREAL